MADPLRPYVLTLDEATARLGDIETLTAGATIPALLVLDASIEYSIVAETAARLAAAGLIPPIAVVGMGVPRREGTQAAALRRFEEFAPPADGYAYDDDLGRIFRSLFALVGEEA